MKKIFVIMLTILTFSLIATGCTKSKSYTYKVETGDKVKVTLKTNDDYNITSDLPFKISKGDDVLSQGSFVTLDGYNQYLNAAKNDSNARIIATDNKNGLEYTFYSYDDKEYNYVIKISDSNTGLLLANNVSEESAKECFSRLTITKE